ncbi:hypothetical protein RclHR1_38090001 [Rhizophagus clarus]|uniref:CCHC-type domain-containing protein n=1 Tax=Rhizophagus clarus TaxID=94130 RepID=A0A2Z6REE4_9GLOM|nr:hypothetical protein RclHR1_38090001 [Rhizophagus clarus]
MASPATLAAAIDQAKLVESGVKYTLLNAMPKEEAPISSTSQSVVAPVPVPTPVIQVENSLKNELDALTKQMQQLSINYANLSASVTRTSRFNQSNNRTPRPENINRPRNKREVTCFKCGKLEHYARECTALGNKRSNQCYETDEYEEYDDEFESEIYAFKRKEPYQREVREVKRRAMSRSESQKEEQTRLVPDVEMQDAEPLKVKKVRRKMLPAPIEQLTEFNIANYLRDLPCGLSVGQAAHEIPKYHSGLIRAVRRTREKETNFIERNDSPDLDQTTATRCELYVGKEPISAVIDSGAVTSIITKSLMKQLGYQIDQPSNMVIVTANGTRIRALGMIAALPIHLSHIIVQTPVHVLDSQDDVLILGNDWLRRVNAIVNWRAEKLSVHYKGRTVNVPLIFMVTKALINAESLEEEEEEEDDEEYENEELVEAPLYYLHTWDSDSDNLEYNSWMEMHSPDYSEEEETSEDKNEGNPAVFLAEVQEENNSSAVVKSNLGPLDHHQQTLFQSLMKEYEDICAKSQTKIGKTHVIRHRILTGDAAPVAQPPYRMNSVKREFLKTCSRKGWNPSRSRKN